MKRSLKDYSQHSKFKSGIRDIKLGMPTLDHIFGKTFLFSKVGDTNAVIVNSRDNWVGCDDSLILAAEFSWRDRAVCYTGYV